MTLQTGRTDPCADSKADFFSMYQRVPFCSSWLVCLFLSAGSARSRQSYAAKPPATQQNGQHDVSEIIQPESKKPGIPVPGIFSKHALIYHMT